MALSIFLTSSNINSYNQNLLEKKNSEIDLKLSGPYVSYEKVKDPYNFILMNGKIETTSYRQQSNNYQIEKATFIMNQLTRASEINEKLKETLKDAQNLIGQENICFKENIKDLLQDLTFELNCKFLGRTTLAGINDNQNATIDLSSLSELPNNALPDSSYYIGGQNSLTIEINENFSIQSFPITAADPAIQQTICAARIALGANLQNFNDQSIEKAIELLDEASTFSYPRALQISGESVKKIKNAQELDEKNEIDYKENIQNNYIASSLRLINEQKEIESSLDIAREVGIKQILSFRDFMKHMKNI